VLRHSLHCCDVFVIAEYCSLSLIVGCFSLLSQFSVVACWKILNPHCLSVFHRLFFYLSFLDGFPDFSVYVVVFIVVVFAVVV